MSALLLLATTFATAVLLLWALWTRSRRLAGIAIGLVAAYAATLLAFSFSSREHLVDATAQFVDLALRPCPGLLDDPRGVGRRDKPKPADQPCD